MEVWVPGWDSGVSKGSLAYSVPCPSLTSTGGQDGALRPKGKDVDKVSTTPDPLTSGLKIGLETERHIGTSSVTRRFGVKGSNMLPWFRH